MRVERQWHLKTQRFAEDDPHDEASSTGPRRRPRQGRLLDIIGVSSTCEELWFFPSSLVAIPCGGGNRERRPDIGDLVSLLPTLGQVWSFNLRGHRSGHNCLPRGARAPPGGGEQQLASQQKELAKAGTSGRRAEAAALVRPSRGHISADNTSRIPIVKFSVAIGGAS